MPYFVISNFASGRDLRRSQETAPSGSLRVLRNAIINEGGEIEKRKAFVREEVMTAYGQTNGIKGRLAGPYTCPATDRAVFFRHRSTVMPGAPFVAGTGDAKYYEVVDDLSGNQAQKFWVQPSNLYLPDDFAMVHSVSASEFGSNAYLVESYFGSSSERFRFHHVYIGFTDDEPVSESTVIVNEDRVFQTVLRGKGYVVEGNTLYGSAVASPDDMSGTGSWTVDLTTQGRPIGEAQAIAEYFGQLVVIGSRGMMFWDVDPDPAANQYLRTIEGSVLGARTVTGYGAGDILYLSRSGIRSLQARDSSNLARVGDVGSPIDLDIREQLVADADDTDFLFGQSAREMSNARFYGLATGIVHDDSGQFWLALRDQVHVLARYPSAKVLAWSTFDLPAAEHEAVLSGQNKAGWVADWCKINNTVVLRNFADEIYVYGGASGDEYDDSEVEVVLPFMDMGRPGSTKQFTGLDLVCEGEWDIYMTADFPGDERGMIWAPIATSVNGNRSGNRIAFDAVGPQIAFRMTCRTPARARLSEIVVHYNEGAQR